MFTKYDYAYMLYKEGSFTRAAEKLFISQPSLSVAIRNIEKEMGAQLFCRTGNGVTLTEAGQAYMDAIAQVIRIEKELKARIDDINALETGQLTVGGSNYLTSYVLPRIIQKFTILYPKVHVTLVEANSQSLLEQLDNGQVDIIIDNIHKPEQYRTYPLTREQILLCVPKSSITNRGLEQYRIHPDSIYDGTTDLQSIPCPPMDAFAKEKFILLKPGNDMYDRAQTIFQNHGIAPEVVFRVDQLNISYALAESGIGLSFVADTFFKYGRFRENVWLYNMGPACSRTLYAAHPSNRYCSRAMEEFIRIAREVVK